MPTCKWVFSGAQHQFGGLPLLTTSMSEMGDSSIQNQVCWVNVHHRNQIAPVAPNASNRMQKTLRETQTLHASCRKVEPKIFSPCHRPLPGGKGRPKFNQLEMITSFTYKHSLVRIDARNVELSWYQTHKQKKN